MQLVWKVDQQQEHLAIAQRAYELFEMRGCENGHDWEDWFRPELQLNLNAFYKKGCQEKSSASTGVEIGFSRSSPTFHWPRWSGVAF